MLKELQQRVNRGIALLNEKRPGWADEIDLTKFAIDDPNRCILCQLYKTYYQGKFELALGYPRALEHGFTFDWCDNNVDELQTIWVAEITKRQQGSK